MTARLYYTSAEIAAEPVEELTVVRLLRGTHVEAYGQLPADSLGAIVFVHNGGEAYEVEFTDPFAAVVTLRRDEFEPTEVTRDTVTGALGTDHRRR